MANSLPRVAGRPIAVYVCVNCGLPSGTLERRSDGTYAHGRQTPCEKVIAEEKRSG
jgi:hypothetical protein